MMSVEENQLITDVRPGSAAGKLLRRYWNPVSAVDELDSNPLRTKEIKVLGEELVLYRDRTGRLGLVERYCPHRRASLAYGVVESDGIRCQYHGWKFDSNGTCVEQPYEDTVHPGGKFRERCGISSYPVQELAGLVFAYLGPAPVPLLPRWGILTWANTVRDISIATVPCNWVQAQENSLDSSHVEHLHDYAGRYFQQVLHGEEPTFERQRIHTELAYEQYEHGIIKRRTTNDRGKDHPRWTIGHSVLFPNILWNNDFMQWRVPIDNTSTLHISLYSYRAAPGTRAPQQDVVPSRRVELVDRDGEWTNIDLTFHQDYLCWATQGEVAARELEKLGRSDRGVQLFRKVLREQIDLVESGGAPTMNVFRDPEDNRDLEYPRIPHERGEQLGAPVIGVNARRDDSGAIRLLQVEAGVSRDIDKIEAAMATWDLEESDRLEGGGGARPTDMARS